MLQNRGFGFRVQAAIRTASRPNKRPMHTIIPGMVMKDGEAVMPYGVMGGHFQPMGQSLFLTNLLEYGLDMQEAIDCRGSSPAGRPVEAGARHSRARSSTRWRGWATKLSWWTSRMAAARRSGSTARPAALSAAATRARTGWRWDTEAARHAGDITSAGCRRHRQCRAMPRSRGGGGDRWRHPSRGRAWNSSPPAWRSAAARPGRPGSPRASG